VSGSMLRVMGTGALGAAGTAAATALLRARPPGRAARWTRTNYGGREVSLLGGAGAAAGATIAALAAGPAALAGVVAGAAGGGFGALDDLGERAEGRSKGFRGHLGALARGRLTTGGAKLLGIGAASLVAAALATGGGRGHTTSACVADVLSSGALVAGTANLVNLLDLRPGRALKGVVALTAPLVLAGGPAAPLASAALGAAAAALPGDLAERTMLGDTGANALGALTGTALVLVPSGRVRAALLAGVVALTLSSERVSFSRVIDANPVLRGLDRWGRAHT
jgi:UDP-N-acetylmuramyl pentapeptide phosphotransferase/UDP-N-acetylglucosamine-1-phosphate transferase